MASATGSNLTFFFEGSLENCPFLNHFTTVVFTVNGIDDTLQLINQISVFLTMANQNNRTRCPDDVPFIILIPLESIGIGSAENTSSGAIGKIVNLILNKMDPPTVQQGFQLDSSVFLVFSIDEAILGLSDSRKFDIWELYSIRNETFLNRVNESLTTLMAGDFEKVSRRRDWNGAEIMSVAFATRGNWNDKSGIFGVDKFELNVFEDPNSKGKFQILSGSGLSASILWDFGAFFNFTPRLLPPLTYDLGTQGAFNQYGRSFDIVVSHFATVPGRVRRFHCLFPTYLDGIVAYFVQPPIYSIRNIHTTPFTSTVWLLVAISWVMVTLSIKLIIWVQSAHLTGVDDRLVTGDADIWAVAAACQHGWHIIPNSIPIRAVYLTGLFLGFLCYASYTATIVSILGKPVEPIDNIQELLEKSRKIYIVEVSSVGRLLLNGIAARRPELFPKVQVTDLRSAFDHVLFDERGSSCVLDWSEYFMEMAQQVFGGQDGSNNDFVNPAIPICKYIRKFDYAPLPVRSAMLVPKGSPLKQSLNFVILIGFERGFFRRYWNQYERNTKVRCLEESNKVYTLNLYDSSFPFLIMLGGYMISVAGLAVETICRRRAIVKAIMRIQ